MALFNLMLKKTVTIVSSKHKHQPGFVLDTTPRQVRVTAGVGGQVLFSAGNMINHKQQGGNELKPRLPIVGDNLALGLFACGLIFLLAAGFILYKEKKSKI